MQEFPIGHSIRVLPVWDRDVLFNGKMGYQRCMPATGATEHPLVQPIESVGYVGGIVLNPKHQGTGYILYVCWSNQLCRSAQDTFLEQRIELNRKWEILTRICVVAVHRKFAGARISNRLLDSHDRIFPIDSSENTIRRLRSVDGFHDAEVLC